MLRTAMERVVQVFCCITVLPLVWNQAVEIPVSMDLTAARVWKCLHPDKRVMEELHRRGYELELEILNAREDWADILTTTSDPAVLQSLGLANCTLVAHLPQLIASELQENWRVLKHHISIKGHNEFVSLNNEQVIDPQRTFLKHLVRRALNPQSSKADCHGREHADCVKNKKKEEDANEDWFQSYTPSNILETVQTILHNVTEIYKWFRTLSLEHPSTVTVNVSIGKTYFERDVMAVHITDKSVTRHKPKIYLQCLLHAREWITGSVCMYIARYLAAPDTSNLMLVDLLKRVEFIIVPVANPDGYYLTWLQYPRYRLWRKNVSPMSESQCSGVDLNRNFDIHWSEADSSADPCSELYHGPSASSELEVQAITDYFWNNKPVIGAIDFHSYYQEILYPPAWTKEDKEERTSKLSYIAQWVAAAASEIGENYTYHKMSEIYVAAGTFPDWVLKYSQRSKAGRNGNTAPRCVVPITVELRPKATTHRANTYTGFMLPVSEILPTCQEMVPAVIKFAQLVLETCS